MRKEKIDVFSFRHTLAGVALSLAIADGLAAANAQGTPRPMASAMQRTTGGMMQMMNDPVAMCDKMMHAIAVDPVMHKKMNDLMRQAMRSVHQKQR